MPRAPWMGKVKAPDMSLGQAPVTRIEAHLEDLKGRPITSRVIKDKWGGNSDILKSSMDKIIDQVASSPDMNPDMLANNSKGGFTPAGTTTNQNPSKVTRVNKKNSGLFRS